MNPHIQPDEQLVSLELASITLDPRLQMRAGGIDPEHVASLAELPADSLPPIDIVFEESTKTVWPADGWHRIEAAKTRGEASITCRVFRGGFRDAMLLALAANAQHGLRRTNADKAKAVDTLLEDSEWRLWSNVEIAERCGVSEGFVRNRRAERGESPKVRKYKDKDGNEREMNTENIGGGGGGAGEDGPEGPSRYAVAVTNLDRLHNLAKQLKAEIRKAKGQPWGVTLAVNELCDQAGVIMAAIREASPAEADETHARGWRTKAEVEERETANAA